MPTRASRRHLRRRRHWRATGPRPWLLAGLAALLAAVCLAPTALARPTSTQLSAGLLPSAIPSVCVGGVVLCGGAAPAQPALPTPCIGGILLCSPLPSILPSLPIGPSATPTGSPSPATPKPSPVVTNSPGPGGAGQGGGGVALDAPLPAPPGVGLVPVPQGVAAGGLAPDSFATVLSLSMRDGLASGRYHLWPWLLLLQLVLWTAIALVAQFRHPSRAPDARRP